MGTAILAILAAAAPVIAAVLLAAFRKRQEPQTKFEEQNAKDDKAIAAGADGLDDINRRLVELEQRLPIDDSGNPS